MTVQYGCPVRAAIKSMSGKWKVQILWHLSFGTLRFAELRVKLAGISEKVLAEQLRQLESDGIVARKVTPIVPPRVDYSLTRSGRELIPMMQSLCDWGSKQFGIAPTLTRPDRPTGR